MSNIKIPDFRFPEKTSVEAIDMLSQAKADSDQLGIVRALLVLCLAKTSISRHNVTELKSQIDEIIESGMLSSDLKALLFHIEARLIAQLDGEYAYSPWGSRWDDKEEEEMDDDYDSEINERIEFQQQEQDRKEQGSIEGEDLSLLPTRERKKIVRALVNMSLDPDGNGDFSMLRNPITKYEGIINSGSEWGTRCVPTLFDFLMSNGIVYFCSDEKIIDDFYDRWLTFHAEDNDVVASIFIESQDHFFKPDESRLCECSLSDSHRLLYLKYQAYEESGLLLRSSRPSDEDYALYCGYLNRFPNSPFYKDVLNARQYIERKSADLRYPNLVQTTDPIEVQVELRNVNECKVFLYRVPAKVLVSRKETVSLSDLELVEEKTVKVEGIIPFRAETQKVTFSPLMLGQYLVLCSYETQSGLRLFKELGTGEIENKLLLVSDIRSFNITTRDVSQSILQRVHLVKGERLNDLGTDIFAVESQTGKPIPNATVEYTDKDYWRSSDKLDKINLETNQEGFVNVHPERGFKYSIKKGLDRYLPEGHSWNYGTDGHEICETGISIFTDLAIYRPGETAHISLFAYDKFSGSRKPLAKTVISLKLSDAVGTLVEKKTVTTDSFGQGCCDFAIPVDRMNGRFEIEAYIDKNRYSVSSHRFEVSEYKTPTFYVDLSDTLAHQQEGEPSVIQGKVMTFSGMPVADCEVECTLSTRTWWYWFDNDEMKDDQTFRVKTDSEGCFRYVCPLDWTNETEDEEGFKPYYTYHINAKCTNAAGETHEKEADFWVGSCKGISLAEDDYKLVDEKPLVLPIEFHSSDPEETSVDCLYVLMDRDEKVVKEGMFNTKNPQFEWGQLPSGVYTLKAEIEDAPEARGIKAEISLYRETDQMPAEQSALWMPKASQSVSDKFKATILLGTATGCHVYYVACSRNHLISRGWLKYAPGMHWFTMAMPEGKDEYLDIHFFTCREGKVTNKNVHLDSPKRDKITLSAVSFRDKIMPGSQEHWTFRLTDAEGAPVKGRMMLELYNQALETLSSNSWRFGVGYVSVDLFKGDVPSYYSSQNITLGYTEGDKNYRQIHFSLPVLEMYGTDFFEVETSYGIAKCCCERSVSPMMADADYCCDCDDIGASMAEESAVGDPDNSKERSGAEAIEIRKEEVKVALWQPQLTSDSDGCFSVEFDVPNFNTTWSLQALSLNSTLSSDIFRTTVLAQKPLMVQPSLPRFLRSGDETRLAANVMNATDESQKVHTVVELFDPRSGSIFNSEESDFELQPHGTRTLTLEYIAPQEAPYVGFRVKAVSANGNGDGEQQLLPILANTSPVIETIPFYQQPGEDVLTIDVAKNAVPDSGSRLTLEYCNNPVWYCVTALPTIADTDSVTSIGLAHTLFALSMAEKLTEENPQMVSSIAEWKLLHQDQNSPLVSQLKKNEDLKIGTLLASPWLPEAERQEIRMLALDKLFDKARNRTEYDKVIRKLESMHHYDGGFSWTDHGNWTFGEETSSYWATSTVVELVGELQHLGCLTTDSKLNRLMESAVQYLDKEILRQEEKMLKQAEKYKVEPSYLQFQSYVYIRNLFEETVGHEDSVKERIVALKEKTLEALEKSWGSLSLPERAFTAITLYRKSRVEVAKNIVESLRQFAIKDSKKGMYWENVDRHSWCLPVACTATILEAFAEVDPRQEEIDTIRQWMLLQKQTSDWGGSSMAADAVYAIVRTGTDWLHNSTDRRTSFQIMVDGKPVKVAPSDNSLGYVRLELPVMSQKIEVTRQGNNPAWGSLYHQFTAPMTEVKAASVDELKIQKEILVLGDNGKWKHLGLKGDAPEQRRNLKVGEKVKVRMVIICSKDLEYVTLKDERPAFLEPVDQTSGYRWDTDCYYLETKDSETKAFFDRLPEGIHEISYECFVTNPGVFSTGIALIQSQYAPQYVAHTAGMEITVE